MMQHDQPTTLTLGAHAWNGLKWTPGDMVNTLNISGGMHKLEPGHTPGDAVLYLRPREVARLKRCRSELVYDSIASGRLRVAVVISQSGRRRFLITACEADRWQPRRRTDGAAATVTAKENEPATALTVRVLGQEQSHASSVG